MRLYRFLPRAKGRPIYLSRLLGQELPRMVLVAYNTVLVADGTRPQDNFRVRLNVCLIGRDAPGLLRHDVGIEAVQILQTIEESTSKDRKFDHITINDGKSTSLAFDLIAAEQLKSVEQLTALPTVTAFLVEFLGVIAYQMEDDIDVLQ